MIGSKIEARMSELGIATQTELARRAGVSTATIHALIRGTRGRRMSVNMAAKLGRALKVPQKFFQEETTHVENLMATRPQMQTRGREA